MTGTVPTLLPPLVQLGDRPAVRVVDRRLMYQELAAAAGPPASAWSSGTA